MIRGIQNIRGDIFEDVQGEVEGEASTAQREKRSLVALKIL